MQAVAAVPSPGPPSVGGCQKTCTVRSPIDPWGGYSGTTVLPCSAAPSGFLTGYYTPSFSRNLVSVSHLHDLGFVTTFPLDEPVATCTVDATGVPLATFHREPGSGLYSLHTGSHHTESGQVRSGQVRSGQVAAESCDYRSLTHPSVLLHHRLGHPSFPHLRRMVRHRLVSGLPKSLAPLPRSHAPPCTPCVEGRQRAIPHSSSFPPTTAPFYTLHLDVWGPSPVRGPRHERYFLIVVDNYSRYTTVLPLRRKADVPTVFKPWLLARAPPALRLAPSCVSHVTPQSSPPQRPVSVVSGGAGGATAGGEGTGAAGAGGSSSGGVGGVGVEAPPVEDITASSRQPCPASTPGFPSVPQFPPRSPPRPIVAESGGVPARGTGGHGGVDGGGPGSGVAGAGGAGTSAPTPRTIRFLTREQRLVHLEREEWELFERAQNRGGVTTTPGESGGGVTTAAAIAAAEAVAAISVGASRESRGVTTAAASALAATAGESRAGIQPAAVGADAAAAEEGRAGVTSAVAGSVAVAVEESRGGVTTAAAREGSAGVPVATMGAVAATAGEGRGGAAGAAAGAGTVAADARAGGAAATVIARPARPSTCTLGSWSPLVPSCSPHPVPFLVPVDSSFSPQSRCVSRALSVSLPGRRPVSPLVLPQPLDSSLNVLHGLLSDYLCASRVLSALVTHPTKPLSSVSALVTIVAGFASSHRLDYAAHLASGPARSPSSGGASVFPFEVLQDRQCELNG
ncbi:unnamed protein product [Closterium sp. NIES-53]